MTVWRKGTQREGRRSTAGRGLRMLAGPGELFRRDSGCQVMWAFPGNVHIVGRSY